MKLVKKIKSIIEAREVVEGRKKAIKPLYKKLTARRIAENQNLEYNNFFQKALIQVLGPKGMGLGGTRENAGNKKGIKFCGGCRQQLDNCTCKK